MTCNKSGVFLFCSVICFVLAFIVKDVLWLSVFTIIHGIYPFLFLAVLELLPFKKPNKKNFNNKNNKKDENDFTTKFEAFLICIR